jgi:uncharacterized protein
MTDFRAAIIAYIRGQAKPAEKFSHQPRLYALTQQLGVGMDYDDDVVFAAAWLHDIGVFIGHRPEDPQALARWDMLAYAMRVVPAILESARFPAGKVTAVLEAIRTHQPAATPRTIEGVILRDADILEQLGATGILRTVCKIGRDTRFLTFDDALRVLHHNLQTLPQQLTLETSRQLAATRIEALREFLKQAANEGLDSQTSPPRE